MPISEFDLYKREWLELVFAGRNKQYGAYQLRSHYPSVVVRALAATLFTVVGLGITVNIIARHRPVEDPGIIKVVEVTISPEKVYVVPEHKIEKPKVHSAAPKSSPVSMQRNPELVVKPDVEVKTPPVALKPDVAIGPTNSTIPGTEGKPTVDAGNSNGAGGDGTTPGDKDIYDLGGLQVMPEPVGGEAAWAKFLQKNLRFPVIARENGVSGKVFLSFIIEKDGHLSDITIVRKAGYGFDEESVRVLKLAPAWKPGMQNGQRVRVKYTIPINFQLSEE